MPMPGSPPVIFPDDFVAEFPAGAGVPFGPAWCRGAGIVPNIAANAAIPLAPPLSTLQFLGARRSTVQLPASITWSTASSSSLTVGTANQISLPAGGLFTWNPAGDPQSNYRFRLVPISGTNPTTAPLNTLITPGVSNIVWDWLTGSTVFRGTLQITDAAGSVIVSCPVNLN